MDFVGLEWPTGIFCRNYELVVKVGVDRMCDVCFVFVKEAVEVYSREVGTTVLETITRVMARLANS